MSTFLGLEVLKLQVSFLPLTPWGTEFLHRDRPQWHPRLPSAWESKMHPQFPQLRRRHAENASSPQPTHPANWFLPLPGEEQHPLRWQAMHAPWGMQEQQWAFTQEVNDSGQRSANALPLAVLLKSFLPTQRNARPSVGLWNKVTLLSALLCLVPVGVWVTGCRLDREMSALTHPCRRDLWWKYWLCRSMLFRSPWCLMKFRALKSWGFQEMHSLVSSGQHWSSLSCLWPAPFSSWDSQESWKISHLECNPASSGTDKKPYCWINNQPVPLLKLQADLFRLLHLTYFRVIWFRFS